MVNAYSFYIFLIQSFYFASAVVAVVSSQSSALSSASWVNSHANAMQQTNSEALNWKTCQLRMRCHVTSQLLDLDYKDGAPKYCLY